jgi:hypothetical protein
MLVAAKAHKARCLKILMIARKSIEDESEKLIEELNKIRIHIEADRVLPSSVTPIRQPLTPNPTKGISSGNLQNPILTICFLPYSLCVHRYFICFDNHQQATWLPIRFIIHATRPTMHHHSHWVKNSTS